MTILETMARGIPSITTRIAAIPEAVTDGWNGILLQPGDIEGLAEAILRLTSDQELRSKFRDRCYETAKDRFSLERHMEQLMAVYRKACGLSLVPTGGAAR